MAIDRIKERYLNEMNALTEEIKLGTELKAIEDRFVTVALKAGDISGGVATVDTGIDFEAWYGVSVTSAAGAPRAITKIEKSGKKIKITATSVAATDVVSVIVK